MSRRKCDRERYSYERYDCERCNYRGNLYSKNNCVCNLNLLVILILILLQFGRKKENKHQLIDNSILFIITLFFLSCGPNCR
jgi:hypothetical protein